MLCLVLITWRRPVSWTYCCCWLWHLTTIARRWYRRNMLRSAWIGVTSNCNYACLWSIVLWQTIYELKHAFSVFLLSVGKISSLTRKKIIRLAAGCYMNIFFSFTRWMVCRNRYSTRSKTIYSKETNSEINWFIRGCFSIPFESCSGYFRP